MRTSKIILAALFLWHSCLMLPAIALSNEQNASAQAHLTNTQAASTSGATAHGQNTSAFTLRNPFQPPAPATSTVPPTAGVNSVPIPSIPSIMPFTTASFVCNYIKAEEACKLAQSLFTGKFTADPVTNTVLFYGTAQEESNFRKLLQQIDIATKQVTLEAKIIALSKEDSKSLGINWNWDNIPIREQVTSNTDSDSNSNYDGNFKFWRGYSFRFAATLNALITNGKARVLATPRIITIPGREASIFIGDHIPVQTEKHDSSGTYTATEYLDAGISLRYTPIIDRQSDLITTSVHTEVSTPVLISELRNYRITSRAADTNVRLKSGETLVIGGLISEEEQKTLQKVPLLGDLPLLGALFRNHTKKKSTSEVIMLLTPHVTSAGESPAIYKQEPTFIKPSKKNDFNSSLSLEGEVASS